MPDAAVYESWHVQYLHSTREAGRSGEYQTGCVWMCCRVMFWVESLEPPSPLRISHAPHLWVFFVCLSVCQQAVHVSALLHALSALNNTHTSKPPGASDDGSESENEATPCTSQPCRWMTPTKWKESTLHLSDTTFRKHDFSKPTKRKIQNVEDFDPRPEGSAPSRLLTS